MTFSLKDHDKGYRRTLAALGPLGSLSIGVQGSTNQIHKDKDGRPQGISIAELAEIHELGLGVPERSWLRAWIEENQDMILRDSKAALQQVILGRLGREQALELLGLKWVASIQKRMSDGQITPELAASTVARKGSSVPLIDTNQLRSAITHLAKVALPRL